MWVQAEHTIPMGLSELYVIASLGIYGGLAAVVFSPIVACRFVRAVFQGPSRRYVSPVQHAFSFHFIAAVTE